MKPITIKDIASKANVSIATVSLVLNDKPSRISEAKKLEIKEIADRLNYRPNIYARGLASKKTKTIGLVIPDIENPFFASLAKNIEKELHKRQYALIVVNSDDYYKNDLRLINILNNRGVDGFLLTLSNEAYQKKDEVCDMLNSLRKPFVLVDRIFDVTENFNQVSFDNLKGQYLATKHLIKRGYKRIGYIAPPHNTFTTKERVAGYKRALEENDIKIDENLIVYGNYRFSSGYDLTTELLNQKVEAVVASNDIMAFGAVKQISESQLKVPEDIAVVGYDDLIFSNMSLVSLTTIRQDYVLLAEKSVDVLFDNLNNKIDPVNIKLNPELMVRNSSIDKYN